MERTNEDLELLEAKKQLILRRRRLFSHYRQYEQWRRRQFSYDPCYYRPAPLPIGQTAYGDYASYSGTGAFRRRRQYRRQFSCAERSREDSRESRESSSLHKYQCHSMMASDTLNTGSSTLNQINQTDLPRSFDGSECGALAYQPLHCNSRHFHMLQEEHSASISDRCTRSRINSAIFVSSEGRGFDSIEFLRRHGSQSVLCRKARSAENITDNERKKSFSENKRQWRTDESDSSDRKDDTRDSCNAIELQECRRASGETMRTLSVLQANIDHASAMSTSAATAVTTSNVIVGSISIEAPPAYMKEDLLVPTKASADETQTKPLPSYSTMSSANSASHDSTDTVEELILVPERPFSTTVAACVETKPRVLVHQRSSNASSSPHSSPKSLTLKGVKSKISSLPMVSVSGPSPPHEKPLPPERL